MHTLALPLQISPQQNFQNASRSAHFEAWKVDETAREVFTIGTRVDQIRARVRMDDEPTSLRTMLEEAFDNDTTLTYRPTGAGGDTFPCKLVSVNGAEPGVVTLTPDPDRYAYGEYTCMLTLRRVDGGNFEDLL